LEKIMAWKKSTHNGATLRPLKKWLQPVLDVVLSQLCGKSLTWDIPRGWQKSGLWEAFF